MSNKIPLIQSAPVSEFGDYDPTELSGDRPAGLERDGSYVPGFSEMRVQRDTQMGKYLRGEIPASQVPALPVNLRWARGQTKDGKPDSAKGFSHGRKGFTYVTEDMVGKNDWLREVPGGCRFNAAGRLANGDMELMVCDAKSAARNEYVRRQETNERMNGLTDTLDQNLSQSGTKTYKGADTYVEKSKGER